MAKPLTVLLIEDSEDDVFLLTRELKRNGYTLTYQQVYTAGDVQAALDKQPWDVIICDYVMPNFSAPAALELMKKTGLDLPFIVVSGAMGEESAVEVMRAGAHDYLTKDKLVRLVPAIEREIHEAANRRERRRALALSTRLGSILDNSSNEIYIFDAASFKIIQTNRSTRENLGYSEAEMSNLTPMDLQVHPDNREFARLIQPLFTRQRDEIIYETVHRRRDGSTYPIEVSVHLAHEETPPVFMAIAQDITERKRAEASLYFLAEASTKLVSVLDYESIFQTVANLAIPFIADLCIVDIVAENKTVQRVAAVHASPDKADLMRELAAFSPIPDKNHPIIRVIQSGQPYLLSVTTSDTFDEITNSEARRQLTGMLGIKSCLIVPMIVRERVVGAISLLITDTERFYGPAEMALAEELARRAAVAIENARLYYEAQQALLMRDQFLSIAAHELKTPITALLGNTQLVQRRLLRNNGMLVERDQRMLNVIEQQAQRLSRMVEALLDISRIRNGTLTLEYETLDINALARRIADEVQPTLERHTLDVAGSHAPIFVIGDGLRLEQVFQNLIQNAVKYSPHGGQIRLEIAGQTDDNYVVISVSDNGIGIPAKAMPNLFHQFFRAENTNQHQIAGMGLGLFVVGEIVALHRGKVEVESVEGRGSTFRVYLPSAPAQILSDAATITESDTVNPGAALSPDGLPVISPFPASDPQDPNSVSVSAH